MIDAIKRLLRRLSTMPDRLFSRHGEFPLDRKRRVISLVQRAEFRDFEEYLLWKISVATGEAMRSDDDRFTLYRKGKSAAWGEITRDMRAFWEEVKRADGRDQLAVKKADKPAILRVFSREPSPPEG